MFRSAQALPQISPSAAVEVEASGGLGSAERGCAAGMVGAVLAHHGLAADDVRVRLSEPVGGRGPTLIQVNLRVGGVPARIQVAGHSAGVAIAAGAARLEHQLRRLTQGWEPWPWPDPQRQSLSMSGRGRIVRVKPYRLHVVSPCQATAAMTAMDYDVHLFTDGETGEDAIVYRAGPTGVRLARQRSMHPPSTPATPALTVNSRRTPTMTPAQAGYRLGEGWLPFLFFTDPADGRGNLLYRRHDGDLGLIDPAAATGPA